MGLVTIHRLSVATAVGALLSLVATGEAGAYTFTKIADTSTTIPNSTGVLQQFGTPAINNGGTVAFKVYAHSARVNNYYDSGMFAGNGGAITTVNPFSRDYSNQDFGISVTIIYTVGDPAINNQGTVVFSACCEFYNGRFVRTITSDNNGLLTTIAMADSWLNDITIPLVSSFNPTINDRGTISFNGVLKNGFSGIFTTNSGQFTTIADNSGIFIDTPRSKDTGILKTSQP
jgi:hypothetical protein